jgi:hypothetical protein
MKKLPDPFTISDSGAMRSRSWQRSLREWAFVVAGVIIGVCFIVAIVSGLEEVLATGAVLSIIALAIFARLFSISFRFDDPLEIGRFFGSRKIPVDQVERFLWEDKSEYANHRRVNVALTDGSVQTIPTLGQIGRSRDSDSKLATRVAADQTVVHLNKTLAAWRAENSGTNES